MTETCVAMDTWDRLLEQLEHTLDPQTFDTWFRPTSMLTDRNGVLSVSVPNEVFRDWLTQKYAGLVREALERFPGGPADIRARLSSGSLADPPTFASWLAAGRWRPRICCRNLPPSRGRALLLAPR